MFDPTIGASTGSVLSSNAFYSIARDKLLCVVPNRHRLQPGVAPCLARTLVVKYTQSMSRWALVLLRHNRRFQVFRAIQKEVSRTCFNTDHESFFRWHVVQRSRFLDPIFRENDVFVCHWRLANPESMTPFLSTSLFLRMTTQKHAQTKFSRRFSLEISSSTMLHVESTTLTRCCRLVVFLAEVPQVTTTSNELITPFTNLALTLVTGSRTMSHQCSQSALYSLQQLYQHGVGQSVADKLSEPTSTALSEGIGNICSSSRPRSA